MNVKDVLLGASPKTIEMLSRRIVYRTNTRLGIRRYRVALGFWYFLSTGKRLNLDAPQTLGEKIQWLKLYDSTPQKGRLADKYLVREWVGDLLGDEYLIPLLGVWDNVSSMDLESLPDRFVLKATHGSGWNIVVKDKSTLNYGEVSEKIDRWLHIRQSMKGGFELHYDFCEPRVVAEAYLEDDSGGLRDYKFVVIGGQVQFILAIEGRYSEESNGVYDPEWNPMPFSYGYRVGVHQEIPEPSRLRAMRQAAELLAKEFSFARVDFYEVNGRVFFGEITFTPASGLSVFEPIQWDEWYGAKLQLPTKKTFQGVML